MSRSRTVVLSWEVDERDVAQVHAVLVDAAGRLGARSSPALLRLIELFGPTSGRQEPTGADNVGGLVDFGGGVVDPDRRLLTLDQVAARLGVHRRTVERWAEKGEIRTVRVGSRAVRIRPTELDRFLKESA